MDPVIGLLRSRHLGWLAAIPLVVGITLSGTARAEIDVTLRANPIWSYSSRDVGYLIGLAMMGGEEESAWTFGGELEYRDVPVVLAYAIDSEGDIVGEITGVETLFLRAHVRYEFSRESPIRPYINMGAGLSFNWLDADQEADEPSLRPFPDTNPVGFDGLLGVGVQVEMPILKGLLASLEMRASLNVVPIETVRLEEVRSGTVQRISELKTDWVVLGGAGVHLGVGYRF